MIKFVYVVPENHYSILDQTGEVKLLDYPEIKEIEFMYSTDLLIEFYKKRDNIHIYYESAGPKVFLPSI